MSEKISVTIKSSVRQTHWRAGIKFAPGVQTVDITEEQGKLIDKDPHLSFVEPKRADQSANDSQQSAETAALKQLGDSLLIGGVDDLKKQLPEVKDEAVLKVALDAEVKGQHRKGAIAAIEQRLAEITQ